MLGRRPVLLLWMWNYDLYRGPTWRRLLQIVHTRLHHSGRLRLYNGTHHLELRMSLRRRRGILLWRLRRSLSARRVRRRLSWTGGVRRIRRDVLQLRRGFVHSYGVHLLVGCLGVQSLVDLELRYRCRCQQRLSCSRCDLHLSHIGPDLSNRYCACVMTMNDFTMTTRLNQTKANDLRFLNLLFCGCG